MITTNSRSRCPERAQEAADDVVDDGVLGRDLGPLVEALDQDRRSHRADDEDDHEGEQPVVAEIELGPVSGQEVADGIAQVGGDEEREQIEPIPSSLRMAPCITPRKKKTQTGRSTSARSTTGRP
jgi:hypothetical protein